MPIPLSSDKSHLTITKSSTFSGLRDALTHHISSSRKHSFRFWTYCWHWKDDPDQVRKECQIYSPTVLIYYAVQSPTRIQPETRTFNHYPTRTRSEVKSVTRQTLLMQENAWLLEQFIKGSIFSLKAVWWIPDSEMRSHPWICEGRKVILKSPTRPNPRVGVSGSNHSTGLWIGSQQKQSSSTSSLLFFTFNFSLVLFFYLAPVFTFYIVLFFYSLPTWPWRKAVCITISCQPSLWTCPSK